MSIDPNDSRVTAYVLGELDEPDRTRFEDDISASEELRRAVEDTRRAADMISESLSAEPCPGLSEAQRERLIARMGDESATNQPAVQAQTGRSERPRMWSRIAFSSALAASLLVACTLAWVQFGTTEQSPESQDIAKLSLALDAKQPATDESLSKFASLKPSSPGQDSSSKIDSLGFGVHPIPSLTENATPRPQTESIPSQGLAGPQSASAPADSPVETRRLFRTYAAQPGNAGKPAAHPVTRSGSRELHPSDSETPAPTPETSLAIIQRQIAPSPNDASIAHPDAKLWKRLTEERKNKAELTDGLDVVFSSDGKTIASGSRDGTVRLWGVDAGDSAVPGLATSDALRRTSGRADEGAGPGWGGDRYDPLTDNPFHEVTSAPLSTFSIDVDTASYSKARMYLIEQRTLPPPGAVRIEELINYFDYAYEGPRDDRPFAAHVEVATCPWQPEHRLVRVGIKGKEIDRSERPTSNLVFLLDVSGSMNQPNKLPLVKRGMQRLAEELGENDQVAIVVYAGAAGLVLPSTNGDQKKTVLDALEQLHAGGSTNGGQGIQLAYQVALDNFVRGGTNRVILCTDGDFNVGTTSTDELVGIVEKNAKDGVFLSVLGFGMGNHNDAMLENISNKGNGNYAFIDTDAEAQKVLVEQLSGTLVTIAKDVKIQVEFNPARVASYRLIGYANRLLAAEDFNDDKKDAGEIGAGHTVTALYEIVPAGAETKVEVRPVDGLKYQQPSSPTEAAASGELLTLKLRYKDPDADTSKPLSFPVKDEDRSFGRATEEFQFAAAVASFGMLLRDSQYKGHSNYDAVLEMAASAIGEDKNGYRAEFLELVARAKELTSP